MKREMNMKSQHFAIDFVSRQASIVEGNSTITAFLLLEKSMKRDVRTKNISTFTLFYTLRAPK